MTKKDIEDFQSQTEIVRKNGSIRSERSHFIWTFLRTKEAHSVSASELERFILENGDEKSDRSQLFL